MNIVSLFTYLTSDLMTKLINLLHPLLSVHLGTRNEMSICGRRFLWSFEHKEAPKTLAVLIPSGIRLVLWLFHGSNQFSQYIQDYHFCAKPFMCKNIGSFIIRHDEDWKISGKQNNEKHFNGLKTLWEVWHGCISQGISLLFSVFYLFLNLTSIPSWFKQQQGVIVCLKVAAASVLAVFIWKQSSKLQEQLLNYPVLSQSAVLCLICVCICGVGLLELWVLCWDFSLSCPPTPFFCNHSPLSTVW